MIGAARNHHHQLRTRPPKQIRRHLLPQNHQPHQYESDGDFQSIEKIGDFIYAGCHCTQDPAYPTARVLSAATGLEVDVRFNIGGNIDGAWSVASDDRGCIWIGGDILDGGFGVGTVWARGFAKFCSDENAAPGDDL